MASDIWFLTILIVRKETRCRHIGYSYRLTARVLLYAPSHRQDSTYHSFCYTSRGALAGMRNSSMGPLLRIDPTTHRTMSERSYHGTTSRSYTSTGCDLVLRTSVKRYSSQFGPQKCFYEVHYVYKHNKHAGVTPYTDIELNSTVFALVNAMAMSSANGLVGTGFASRYRLQLRAGF